MLGERRARWPRPTRERRDYWALVLLGSFIRSAAVRDSVAALLCTGIVRRGLRCYDGDHNKVRCE